MNTEPIPPATPTPQDKQPRLAKGSKWGSFEILALVGRGSFGEVYRAWDPQLQREIALKILMPRSTAADTQFGELLREARALASVRHPNIVAVYGVDRCDNLVGFWTDFVHGKTLARLIREQGAFGHREAALIGLDIGKALSAVHRAGLLHRDIKAENVMREEGGRILLMDFGLSSLPQQQSLAGTPRYMAPELFSGSAATVSSDIYAVGVLLFYLVAAQFPGEPTTPSTEPRTELLGDEVTVAAPREVSRLPAPGTSASRSVLDYRPDIPEAFARVIDTAIHPDPHKRFSSAGALSAALSEVVSGPIRSHEPIEPAIALDRTHSHARSRIRDRNRSRTPLGVAAALLVFLAVELINHSQSGIALFGLKIGPSASTHGSATDASRGPNDEYLKADALLLRYDKRKNVSDAIILLNDVLKQDPNSALAQAGLGRAYYLQYRVSRAPGLLDQARAACNRAISVDSTLAPPHATLARIEAMAGNTALATQEAGKALQLDPRSADAYGAQSEVLNAEGRTADAIASVQKAIDLDPNYWRWPVWLGNYYFANGKLVDAAGQYRKAVSLTPDNATAQLDLGLVSLQLGKLEDARVHLDKSAAMEPSYVAFSALAELLTTQGNYDAAIGMSKRALDLNPTNYLAWGNLASEYLLSGSRDKAQETFRKAIDLAEISRKDTPRDPGLLASLGEYYAMLGESSRSLPFLRQAIVLAPDDPDVLFAVGYGFEMLHLRNDAIQLIAKSLALGYHANELEWSQELASLRADPKFQMAVHEQQAKLSLDTPRKRR